MAVLLCIVQRRKGSSPFASGFFTIYVIQGVADIAGFILDALLFRLPAMGCVGQDVLDFPQGNVGYLFLSYAANILFTAHTTIGINRFLVLTDAWTKRKEHIVAVAIFVVSLPNAALRLFGRTRLVETAVPGVYSVVREMPWIVGSSTMVQHTLSAAVTIWFELLSLARYRSLTAAARQKYRNDFVLLIYALLQLCTQLLAAVSDTLFSITALTGDFRPMSVGVSIMHYNSVALYLSSPFCLLSTSKLLRRAWLETYYPFSK